jgi:hypothetical protein
LLNRENEQGTSIEQRECIVGWIEQGMRCLLNRECIVCEIERTIEQRECIVGRIHSLLA